MIQSYDISAFELHMLLTLTSAMHMIHCTCISYYKYYFPNANGCDILYNRCCLVTTFLDQVDLAPV